jgi:hypothetical protein
VELSGLVRGYYGFRVKKRGLDNVSCGWEGESVPDCLNLFENGRPQLLECDFNRGACAQQDLVKGSCQSRIANNVGAGLHALLADFRRRRASLASITTEKEYRVRVQQLLGSTEESLIGMLPGDELAAMRDSVRLTFQRAHSRIPKSTDSGDDGTADPEAGVHSRFVSLIFEGHQDGGFVKSIFDPALDVAEHFLFKLVGLADEELFSASLCVISRPGNATVRVRPAELPQKVRGGSTTVNIEHLDRGRYTYSVEWPGSQSTIQCGWEKGKDDDLDCVYLMNYSNRLLECERESGLCKVHNIPSGGCPVR